jgi:geranylgeranyl diphosphate synthase, type I
MHSSTATSTPRGADQFATAPRDHHPPPDHDPGRCDPVSPIAGRVEDRIHSLLDLQRRTWVREQAELASLFDALDDFVGSGGKRLRPAFCYWGAVGAGATGHEPELLDVCAALELLHAFALIHDDVMDDSSTRRGQPTVHMRFAMRHAVSGWSGDSQRHGVGLAILTGDLAFVLADSLLDAAPAAVRRLWHRLRVELVSGQWVDVVAGASTRRSPALARWVSKYKSGRYTVERPLHLGAALAGRNDLIGPYASFGEPLGQAFQLRDDVLGVFGDPSATGKPSGDDLREGKPTLLLAHAAERARGDDRRLIERIGSPDLNDAHVRALRRAFDRTGARRLVEVEIARLTEEAERGLASCAIAPAARAGLHALAGRGVRRER